MHVVTLSKSVPFPKEVLMVAEDAVKLIFGLMEVTKSALVPPDCVPIAAIEKFVSGIAVVKFTV